MDNISNNRLFNDVLDFHHLLNIVRHPLNYFNRWLISYFSLTYNEVTSLDDQLFGDLFVGWHFDFHIDWLGVSLSSVFANDFTSAWNFDQSLYLCKYRFLDVAFNRLNYFGSYWLLFDYFNFFIFENFHDLCSSNRDLFYLLNGLVSSPQRNLSLSINFDGVLIMHSDLLYDYFFNLVFFRNLYQNLLRNFFYYMFPYKFLLNHLAMAFSDRYLFSLNLHHISFY